ncbi:MAG: hypothetical protein ABR558_06830 [Thioalkalivibrio sp.]
MKRWDDDTDAPRVLAWIGTRPEPIAEGSTKAAAISAALEALHGQGAIGDGLYQYPDDHAAIKAMSFERLEGEDRNLI